MQYVFLFCDFETAGSGSSASLMQIRIQIQGGHFNVDQDLQHWLRPKNFKPTLPSVMCLSEHIKHLMLLSLNGQS